MRWAPATTNNHLLEYIRKTDSLNDQSLRLTINAVLKNMDNPGVLTGESLVVDDPSTSDISLYLSSLSTRADYLGQIKGMLMMLHSTDEQTAEQSLIDHLERILDDAGLQKNEDKMGRAIMLMAAFFIHLKDLNHRLLRALIWVPLRNFTDSTMRLSIMSWNWILVARADFQIDFFQEMASCWIKIAQRDMGVFAPDDAMACPLSCRYANRRPSPLLQPHALWVNFLTERVTLAKFCNQEQIDLFELMFIQTLSLRIGDSTVPNVTQQSTSYIGCAGFHS
uniref:PI4-kinase N-terminal domain-containing protein n=1 Tax=Acrobeloides nanus TaxID=290746 RepID=A0A914DAH7_9BILA